jgi:hypothetical protein
MRKLLLAGALAIGVAAPTFAQDPAALEQARIVLDKTNAKAMTAQVLPLVMTQITNLIQQANPAQGELVKQVMDEAALPAMQARLPDLMENFARLYANRFSADELKELVAFYDTPLGKKLIEQQPRIAQDSMLAGLAWGRSVGQDVIKQILPELEKRGLKAPPI